LPVSADFPSVILICIAGINRQVPLRGWIQTAALLPASLARTAVMVAEPSVLRILTPAFGGSMSVCLKQ
jgi:hypothetical protein